MPDDINKRMNYFDRQFLRAADFKVEQDYHLQRHRLHNKLLHTPGVAGGNHLMVSGDAGSNSLKVAEGIAIDEDGREIVLLQQHHYDIPAETKPGTYELTVRLEEVPSDPSTDPGVEGNTRTSDTPTFELLTPNLVKPPMLRLAKIEVEPAGTLKSEPTSVRPFAGTTIGASGSFESVTADTFTLKKGGVDIAKRPDLSCASSGDILFRTTRPANSSPEESLRITTAGLVKSPMWNLTPVFVNKRAGNTVGPENTIFESDDFKTGGGTLMIFASGSGASAQAGTQSVVIGMDMLLDNASIGKVQCCVKNQDPQPFVTAFLTVPNLAAGTHRIKLRTLPTTTVGGNDFFNVTILELPF